MSWVVRARVKPSWRAMSAKSANSHAEAVQRVRARAGGRCARVAALGGRLAACWCLRQARPPLNAMTISVTALLPSSAAGWARGRDPQRAALGVDAEALDEGVQQPRGASRAPVLPDLIEGVEQLRQVLASVQSRARKSRPELCETARDRRDTGSVLVGRVFELAEALGEEALRRRPPI